MNLPTGFLALRERFLSRLPERLERMRVQLSAFAGGDSDALSTLKREAHSLVGAAGLHEMTELAQRAAQVEELANPHAALGALTDALARVAETIESKQSAGIPDPEPKQEPAAIALLFQGQDAMASQAALLEGAGYCVRQYHSIEAFEVAIAADECPDLLLLGLQFDGDDNAGVRYLSRLRNRLAFPFPLLVLSASRSMDRGIAAYREGAARVLAQPIPAAVLLQHVAETLAAREIPARKVLVAGALADGGLARFITELDDPLVSFDFCTGAADIQTRLAGAAIDAIMLDGSTQDAEALRALVSLLRDHPDAAHLPIIVFSCEDDPRGRSAAWSAGSAAVINAGLAPAEFGPMLRALCRDAARGRNDADTAARQQYEHARHRQALDHHAIISLADASGTLFETSPRHGALTGFERTELIGSHLHEYREGLAPPELTADILAKVQRGQVWQGEYTLHCKHAQTRWVHTTLVPFLDPQGNPYQYMLLRSDITDRKLGEQALADARSRETALAAQIQETLLLPPLPATVGGIPIASCFRASAGVAGDFHALIELGPDTFDLMIGDVMGKGVPAALVGAAVKMELNQCLLELGARSTATWPPQPTVILDALHQRLTPRLIELECFVTLAYVRFNQLNQTLTSVGCGHPEMLIFAPDGVHEVANQHPPLGTVLNEVYSQTTLPWPKGSVVLLYSDGLSETADAGGQMLEVSGLKDIASAALAEHTHPGQIATFVLAATDQFAGGRPPEDDRTLIAVRRPNDGECFFGLENTLDSLPALRERLLKSCPESLHDQDLDRIALVCVEAFTNIVKHAQSSSSTIEISLQHRAGLIELSLHYDGKPFEPPPPATLPEPEKLRESGYGLPLIHALCDSFSCRHSSGTNTNHLVFHLMAER